MATDFKIALSETAWSVNAKFYVEPFWEVETSIYKCGLCHMTKIAVMPIYCKKTLRKSFCLEP